MAIQLIEWKVKAYVYLVKAGRMEVGEIPEEYREVVIKKLVG